MQPYLANSPEAIARVLAMMLISDGHLDDREIERMRKIEALRRLGVPSAVFLKVARDYCRELADLAAHSDDDTVGLIDFQRIDATLDAVTDPVKRVLLSRLSADLIACDGTVDDGEVLVYEHMLSRWQIDKGAALGAPARH
jgi:uncharacterized tellurite resistance protein B-like protein